MAQTSTKRNAAHFPLAPLSASLNATIHGKLIHQDLLIMTGAQKPPPESSVNLCLKRADQHHLYKQHRRRHQLKLQHLRQQCHHQHQQQRPNRKKNDVDVRKPENRKIRVSTKNNDWQCQK
jgi:hypothetical protein